MATGLINILCLNDDCLYSIFSYFKLPELIVVQKVCKKFTAIAEMHYEKYRAVDFTELAKYYPKNRITYDGADEIGAAVGKYVTAVKISLKSVDTRSKCCNLPMSLLTWFRKLEYLCLDSYNLNNCVGMIVDSHLKHLQLERCKIDENIFASWFRYALDNLEVLKFDAYTKMCGMCFGKYAGENVLDELKIYHGIKFAPRFFEGFCEGNPEVKKLTISIDIGCNYNSCFFESIAEFLKDLDMLVIMEILVKEHPPNINYEMIRALPSITKLRVDSLGDERAHKLDVFLESVAKQIECLNLTCKEERLLEVLTHFTKLRVLILKNLVNFQPSTVLSCAGTLEELHLINCDAITSDELKELLLKLKTLKLLNLCGCNLINFSILSVIEECLGGRTQKLEIVIMRTPFGKEMKLKRNGQKIREFLVKMKGKIKFTNFGYNLNGTPIQSFHEWDEWKGDQVSR